MEKQFKNNGKIFHPLQKLVKGIILFTAFWLIYNKIGANGLRHLQVNLENDTFSFMSKDLASIFSNLVMLILGFALFYCFVSGLYRICTFNIHNAIYDEYVPGGVPVKGHNSFPNINKVLNFRESAMKGMSPERAAELYVASSKIENLTVGPETQRVLSYIESKLAGMSPQKGLNFLANRI
jgi:hypothetical protein